MESNTAKGNTLETSLNFAHDTIGEQKSQISKLEKDVRVWKAKLDSTHQLVTEQQRELAEYKEITENRFNDIERRSRSYSIRVKGVPATNVNGRQDHRTIVAEILVKNKLVDATETEVVRALEIAHPLGKPVAGKYNFIARFYARPFRNAVVKAAKQHKGNLFGAEKIVEDLIKSEMDKKTKAFPQMQEAYQKGHKVRFQNGKLLINGEVD